MGSYVNLVVLRSVALVGLVAGVGITVLFSVAVRALTTAQDQPDQPVAAGSRLLAAGCLLIVLAAVAVGLWAVLAK